MFIQEKCLFLGYLVSTLGIQIPSKYNIILHCIANYECIMGWDGSLRGERYVYRVSRHAQR